MNRHTFLIAVFVGASAAGTAGAQPLPAPLAVGLRLGHSICETYVNGPDAGTQRSLICDLAGRPAVLIYARAIDPALLTLLRKLDAVAEGGKEAKMKSSCVLLTTKDEDKEPFQALAKREKLRATILAMTPSQQERPYLGSIQGRRFLHKDARVTVILLTRLQVESSYAFRKDELTAERVDEIVKAAAALLPAPRK
ncbi:MAG: hypothetical protein HYR84_15450 [Planctomycetes bacterium]|nr:hypothetical protein [Planctomycetota bacterium]